MLIYCRADSSFSPVFALSRLRSLFLRQVLLLSQQPLQTALLHLFLSKMEAMMIVPPEIRMRDFKKTPMILVSYLVAVFLYLPVNANAPDTRLVRIDGVEQSMSDYIGQGKWVIVNVWSPSCSFCVQELPHVEKFRRDHTDVTVMGITLDYPSFGYGKIDIIREFLENHPLDYPIFLADIDQASEVIGNRLVGIPLIAIFHPDGEVLARWPGNIDVNEIEEFMQNYEDYTPEESLLRDF
jgi:thiol-disulfide isomerase/thioredoxin